MLLLADESCDFSVVQALRTAGYDVLAIAEFSPQASDEEVMALAVQGGRLLLTQDKDFGHLVYAKALQSSGVILLRFPAYARNIRSKAVLEAINRFGERLSGAFVILEPGRMRIGRAPGRPDSKGSLE